MASEFWRFKKKAVVVTFLTAVLGTASWQGCASPEVTPIALPRAPEILRAAQPSGTDLTDIEALFQDPSAPARAELRDCDSDFRRLTSLTTSSDEIRRGACELVRLDPSKYHWCFYSRLLDLFAGVKASNFIDERQKATLDGFYFLTTVARGFMSEFRDSRYLRVAVKHYRRVSEWVFYRRLELTPQGTAELVDAENPFGFWREQASQSLVLSKYNLVPIPGPKAKVHAPLPADALTPLAEQEPVSGAVASGTSQDEGELGAEPVPLAQTKKSSKPVVDLVDSEEAPETLVIEEELENSSGRAGPGGQERLPAGATSGTRRRATPVAVQQLSSSEDLQVLAP